MRSFLFAIDFAVKRNIKAFSKLFFNTSMENSDSIEGSYI